MQSDSDFTAAVRRLLDREIVERVWASNEAQPGPSGWEATRALLAREPEFSGMPPFWYFPILVADSLSVDRAEWVPAAAAYRLLMRIVRVIDDAIDGEADGFHVRHGAAGVGNAVALLQSAAAGTLIEADIPEARKLSAIHRFERVVADLAAGAGVDMTAPATEEGYWQAYQETNGHLIGYAFSVGPTLGGMPEAAARFAALGWPFAMALQMQDDLHDAFSDERLSDWAPGARNCAIAFAADADHPDREEFRQAAAAAPDPAALERAREILLASGAVSYCIFQALRFAGTFRGVLEEIAPPDPAPLETLADLLEYQPQKLAGLEDDAAVTALRTR